MTMEPRRARMLAVVRCGDASLHRSWCDGDFDVAISYYGGDADRTFDEAKFLHRYKGGKWDGIFNFFESFPDAKDNYDFFWFPDDDIRATASDVERLIDVGQELSLDLFQPALDTQSYYSHLITLQHPSFHIRYTNFVEIMVPMLSARLFHLVLPTIAETRSGFGLDFLWPQLATQLPNADHTVAIIDDVTITHTRPVGGDLHKFMKKTGGQSAEDELSGAISAVTGKHSSMINGVATPLILITDAVDHEQRHPGALSIAGATARDLLFTGRNRVQPAKSGEVLRHAVKAWLGARG